MVDAVQEELRHRNAVAGPDAGALALEILHGSDEAMYAMDRDWRVVELNQPAADYFQLTRDEMLGQKILDLFPQARGTPLEAALTSVMEGGPEVRLETRSPSWPDRHAVVKVFPTTGGLAVWFRNVTRERTEEQARLAELETIYQTAPVGLAMLDRELRYLRCNERLAEINGLPAQEHLGRRVRDVVPELADVVEPMFRSVFETGEASTDREVSGSVPSRPHEIRTWVENVCPLRDDRGEVAAILISVQEITARKRAEAALTESEAKLRAANELSLDGFMILRAVRDAQGEVEDFTFEFANRAARAFAPTENPDPTKGRLLQAMPQLRDHAAVFPRYVRLLAERGADEAIVKYDVRGDPRWFRDAAVALDEERLAVSFHDITKEHQAEQQLKLVIRELEHRGKNTLALIQGLMRLSLRGATSMSEFQRSFTGRLRVLGEAQALITHSRGGPVLLRDLVTSALAPFRQPGLHVDMGPSVELPPETSLSLTLALHELATNALKYGALSRETGVVSFGWSVRGRQVELTWQESGGPPVVRPERSGLGSPLVAGALRGIAGGVVRHEFNPDGVRCEMSFAAPGARADEPPQPAPEASPPRS